MSNLKNNIKSSLIKSSVPKKGTIGDECKEERSLEDNNMEEFAHTKANDMNSSTTPTISLVVDKLKPKRSFLEEINEYDVDVESNKKLKGKVTKTI
jgi:hypothetical protein